MQTMPTFVGLKAASSTIATRQVSVTLPRSSRQQLAVKASVMAEPATIDVKNLDGSSAGSAALSLRVADNETSKGLVHRYLVLVRQNARRVSIIIFSAAT
jgi:large subunit ribosomal protein L4